MIYFLDEDIPQCTDTFLLNIAKMEYALGVTLTFRKILLNVKICTIFVKYFLNCSLKDNLETNFKTIVYINIGLQFVGSWDMGNTFSFLDYCRL